MGWVMNLPRISWKRYLNSRFFPWSLVAVLLVVMGGGSWYGAGIYKELEESSHMIETLKEKVERSSFELAQAEWALKQEKNRSTTKVREERRTDGTVIVEREEETEATSTESEGSGTTTTQTEETVDREQTTEVTERRREVSSGAQTNYQLGGGATIGADLTHRYEILGGLRLGGLPLWLIPSVEIDGVTYIPVRAGLGLTWEF